MVLVSVSKILTFTFFHLVISGVSCYCCLCLEIVPLVILLHYISRPGRLALFPEFQWSEQSLQARSPLSGRCTVIWCLDLLLAKDEGPKQDLSPKLCCFGLSQKPLFRSPHSHLCRLLSVKSRNQGGSCGMRGRSFSGLVDTCALTRKVAGCLEPKRALPQRLCGSRPSQKLPAAESQNQGGSHGN